jgi:hypothetical protein
MLFDDFLKAEKPWTQTQGKNSVHFSFVWNHSTYKLSIDE